MKISVVTPSYNQASFISATIESVLSQQGNFELEHIVVDGGSTDGTQALLKTYESDPRFRWVSEPDDGQSDAVNKGWRMATGEILGWLNSDDIYLPGCLNSVHRFFLATNAHWCYGKCKIIDAEGAERNRFITLYKNRLLSKYSYNKLLTENFISQMTVFFRSSLIDTVGYLDPDLHFCMDYEYWLRIGSFFDPGYIKKYLACFRWQPNAKGRISLEAQLREKRAIVSQYARGKNLFLFLHRVNAMKILLYYRLIDAFRAR